MNMHNTKILSRGAMAPTRPWLHHKLLLSLLQHMATNSSLAMIEDKNYSMCPRTSLISDLYCDSQVLEAFKVAHSARDFAILVVAREIKHLELPKLVDLCWDWPDYAVVPSWWSALRKDEE
jgi:hypothetical protein